MEEKTSANIQMTKVCEVCLMHLFKKLVVQVHCRNHFVFSNRAQLDHCQSTGPSSYADPLLSWLANIFNDYSSFQPQIVIVSNKQTNKQTQELLVLILVRRAFIVAC